MDSIDHIDRLDVLVNRVRVLEAAIEGFMNVNNGRGDTLEQIHMFTGFLANDLNALSQSLSEQADKRKGTQP